MDEKQLKIVRATDVNDFNAWVWEFNRKNWPEFMFKDPVASNCWPALQEKFAPYQFAIVDRDTNEILVQVNSLPLAWAEPLEDLPVDGWDWALQQGVRDNEEGRAPTVQCALQIAIGPKFRGQGISSYALKVMKQIGRENGLSHLLAPVRPNRKADFPKVPIDDYVEWATDEGLPFDPWLRVHVRAGARIIKVCHQSMLITGTVAEWSAWTGLTFPSNGDYEVEGALVPVSINCEANNGRYVEPNVWVCHDL